MKSWLKSAFRDNKGFLIFVLCFGVFRTAVADWNPIPSGSMRPTILEGDVVWVNRLAYNLKIPLTDIAIAHFGDPKRGDIVTFASPTTGTRLIKRIVAIPGDRVAMQRSVLYINGAAAEYANQSLVAEPLDQGGSIMSLHATERIAGEAHPVQFLPKLNARRDFAAFTVPADSYFMLGDNRDNSEDSRYIGVVPRKLLIGQANRLVVSAAIKDNWLPRLDRFGKSLD